MDATNERGISAVRRGGIKPVRDGVWGVDVELPRAAGEPRRSDFAVGRRADSVTSRPIRWFPDETWQCLGRTGFASQFTRLEFLDNYDACFVIVTKGPIDEALAYKARVGNKMAWYSSANSSFGADMGARPGGDFQVNVFLRGGDSVYRTYNTQGRGTEQLSHSFALIDLLPYGPPGGLAGLARRLAAVCHLQRLGPFEDFARYAEQG